MKKFLAFFLSLSYVQGHFGHVSNLTFNTYSSANREMGSISESLHIYDYNEVLRHHKIDTRKRQPQFLGFDIQDDNIEVEYNE